MPDLDRPDARLHYEVSGRGPPVLMVAGFMSDSASWAPLLPLLEPHLTLIRPDNRTTGRTTPWDAPVSMEHWVGDLAALLDHLDLPRAHVVGHSLGGNIGWALAATAPERVASLLTLGSAPIATLRNTDLFRALIAIRRSDAPPDTWLRALFPWLFSEDVYWTRGAVSAAIEAALSYPHAQSADAMEHQLNVMKTVDPAPFEAPPPVPFHAVLSRDDLLVPLDRSLPSLEGVRTTILDGPGHSIHWDAPETVARLIREMVAETGP